MSKKKFLFFRLKYAEFAISFLACMCEKLSIIFYFLLFLLLSITACQSNCGQIQFNDHDVNLINGIWTRNINNYGIYTSVNDKKLQFCDVDGYWYFNDNDSCDGDIYIKGLDIIHSSIISSENELHVTRSCNIIFEYPTV